MGLIARWLPPEGLNGIPSSKLALLRGGGGGDSAADGDVECRGLLPGVELKPGSKLALPLSRSAEEETGRLKFCAPDDDLPIPLFLDNEDALFSVLDCGM